MKPRTAPLRALLAAMTAALLVVLPALQARAQGSTFVLKYACFAPEGSTYVTQMRAWDAELRKRSGGRLSFRIFPGGIQGDERDMVRKLRIGQLQMVGMTGIGLGEALPAIRVLEMPAYYRDYSEVDVVTRAVEPELERRLRTAGYELLGWGEAGTVHIFSQKQITSLAALGSLKIWGYEGDAVGAEIFRVFKITPVPLSLADVLSSLQAGIIDSVYGTPLGAVALQWSRHLKYMTRQNLGRAMGGTVISMKAWSALPADLQALLKETGRTYHQKIVEGARAENEKAVGTLARAGMTQVDIPEAEWKRFLLSAADVRENLTGTVWTADLVATADAALAAHRTRPVVKP